MIALLIWLLMVILLPLGWRRAQRKVSKRINDLQRETLGGRRGTDWRDEAVAWNIMTLGFGLVEIVLLAQLIHAIKQLAR